MKFHVVVESPRINPSLPSVKLQLQKEEGFGGSWIQHKLTNLICNLKLWERGWILAKMGLVQVPSLGWANPIAHWNFSSSVAETGMKVTTIGG